ncbi:hypothetical protein LX32DRAFT_212629 [Colletotrichum zoysiae]|uniref:Uncharacterized protein n=1 Tax=Colletotrichum zoysiae TaxID=1216348 RepID=A0AAD9H5Z8_9PEZI|nr:hypothetical protein LX32DRAFT_212629 [Colletotrichum zoysiae]
MLLTHQTKPLFTAPRSKLFGHILYQYFFFVFSFFLFLFFDLEISRISSRYLASERAFLKFWFVITVFLHISSLVSTAFSRRGGGVLSGWLAGIREHGTASLFRCLYNGNREGSDWLWERDGRRFSEGGIPGFIGGEQVSQTMRDVISQGGRGGKVFGRDCDLVFFFSPFVSSLISFVERKPAAAVAMRRAQLQIVFLDEKRESVSRRNVETEMSRNESHESMTIKRNDASLLLFESAFFFFSSPINNIAVRYFLFNSRETHQHAYTYMHTSQTNS